MTDLRHALAPLVDRGTVPGLVAAAGPLGDVEVVVAGASSLGGPPLRRDSLFRLASLTKPMLAAATLTFVADGALRLDDEVRTWVPELAEPRVLRDPSGPVTDTVPAARPVTVVDLLRSTAGLGFPGDLDAPIVRLLGERLGQGPPRPQAMPDPDAWAAALATVPLTFQPGAAYAYNAPFDVLGLLLARLAGTGLGRVLRARLFDPLGMADAGFCFPPGTEDRRTTLYDAAEAGLREVDGPDGQWAAPPAFEAGASGLVGTLDDVVRFAELLLRRGGDLLPSDLVDRMLRDQLTPAVRAHWNPFLDGQSWGFGGGVDLTADPAEPWRVPGRYGWVGGTGTSAYVVPAHGTLAVLLTQVELGGPGGAPALDAFWRATAPT